MIYTHLGTPKRYRSWQEWSPPKTYSFLGWLIDADFSSNSFTSGEILNGLRNVALLLKSWSSICHTFLFFPSLRWKEVLYAYIMVTDYAVSLVLVRTDVGVQKPVYYISKSLQEAETRCLPLEKAILAIKHATRKFLHYFQSHTIVVLTQLPLQALLQRSNYTRMIAKWGTMLGHLISNTCLV